MIKVDMILYDLVLIFVIAQQIPFIESYKTVVLVHGLNTDGGEFYSLKPKILSAHPGTNVVELNYSPNDRSLDSLSQQMKSFKQEIDKVLETTKDGIHLVCHSQGGLLCLGYLEFTENHKVEKFISLSAPLFGQYGLPKSVTDAIPALVWFKNLEDEAISEILYDYIFQNSLSIANYWRDPRPAVLDKYEETSMYLPLILNDPLYHNYNITEAAQRKKNFLKLKHLVLAGGPDDEIIKPWQSPLFGYFDENPKSGNVVNMTEQKVFTEDWFGLRILHESNRLTSYVIPGINHGGWVVDDHVFKTVIIDWLT